MRRHTAKVFGWIARKARDLLAVAVEQPVQIRLFLHILGLALSAPAAAQGVCSATGQVVDSTSGAPVSGVFASLSRSSGGSATQITNARGMFDLRVANSTNSLDSTCVLLVTGIARTPVTQLVRGVARDILVRLSERSVVTLRRMTVRPNWLRGVNAFLLEETAKPGRQLVSGAMLRQAADGSRRDPVASISSNSGFDVSNGAVRLGGMRSEQTALRLEGIGVNGIQLPGLLDVDVRATTASSDPSDGGYSGGAVETFVSTASPAGMSVDISSGVRTSPFVRNAVRTSASDVARDLVVGSLYSNVGPRKRYSSVAAVQLALTGYAQTAFAPTASWIDQSRICADGVTRPSCLGEALSRRGVSLAEAPSLRDQFDQAISVLAKIGDTRSFGFDNSLTVTAAMRRFARRATATTDYAGMQLPAVTTAGLFGARTDSLGLFGSVRQTLGVTADWESYGEASSGRGTTLLIPSVNDELLTVALGGPLIRLGDTRSGSAQYSLRGSREFLDGAGTLRYSVNGSLFETWRGGVLAGSGVDYWSDAKEYVLGAAPTSSVTSRALEGVAGRSLTGGTAVSWSQLLGSRIRVDAGVRFDGAAHWQLNDSANIAKVLDGRLRGAAVSPRFGLTIPLTSPAARGRNRWRSEVVVAAGRYTDVPRGTWLQSQGFFTRWLSSAACRASNECAANRLYVRDPGVMASSWKTTATIETRGHGFWVIGTGEVATSAELPELTQDTGSGGLALAPSLTQRVIRQTGNIGWSSSTSPWNFNLSVTGVQGSQRGPAYALGVRPGSPSFVRAPLTDTKFQSATASIFYSVAGEARVDLNLAYGSGKRFTPVSGSDLNGDGQLNDLVSLPLRHGAVDQWDRLAGTQVRGAASCLVSRRGELLDIGSCRSAGFFRADLSFGVAGRLLHARWIRWASLDVLNASGLVSSFLFGNAHRVSLGAAPPVNEVITRSSSAASEAREAASPSFGSPVNTFTQAPTAGIRLNVQGYLWRRREPQLRPTTALAAAERRRLLRARWPDPIIILVTSKRLELGLSDRPVEALLTVRERFVTALNTATDEIVANGYLDGSKEFVALDRKVAREYRRLTQSVLQILQGKSIPTEVSLLLRPSLMADMDRL